MMPTEILSRFSREWEVKSWPLVVRSGHNFSLNLFLSLTPTLNLSPTLPLTIDLSPTLPLTLNLTPSLPTDKN